MRKEEIEAGAFPDPDPESTDIPFTQDLAYKVPQADASLDDWAHHVHAAAQKHGWHDEERSVGDIIALLHSELSEALEEYRETGDVNKAEMFYGKPEGFPIELADVLIRLLDACQLWEIDITRAMQKKAQYNITRPYRHGGKKL